MPDIYSESKNKVASEDGGKDHTTPGHTHNPVAAFCYSPDGVKFETQEDKEQIVLLLRQHPIINIPWVLMAVILSFAPSLLTYFPLISFLPANFQFVAILFWYLIVLAFVVESFLSWYFNVYIVTDERIVDVDFVNLIYKEISDAQIENVQEVTHSVGGVVGTLFNFGDVRIQTASALPSFEFENVPDPGRVAKILEELKLQEQQEEIEGRVR